MPADKKTIPVAEQRLLQQLVQQTSLRHMSTELGVTRETIMRACGGLPIRTCSREVLLTKLAPKAE
jgi:hypothetical protein